MKSIAKRFLLATVLAVLTGCATPESRIKEKPEVFALFPPEVQANVKAGKIDIGYDKDMVYIALGKPDREYTRTTAEGTTEVWSYTATYSTSSRQLVNGPFRVRDSQGIYHNVSDSVWVDVQQQHEYEKTRIEFVADKVKAIENVQR
jgi:hypothetical protein